MNYWKEHAALRIILMIAFFVVGLILVFWGWSMTGELVGLGLMIVGLILLLSALFIYNKPFQDKKDRSHKE